MSAHSVTAEETPNVETAHPVVRFLQGANLLGQTAYVAGNTLVEHAEDAGVKIPTNCTSGTCGTCMVTLLYGEVPLPEILPPGLDDYLVEECARLACIGIPNGDVDVDIRPPL
ncbi:MAG: (2Fe-2S)-binding protein [Euryarchaeota archaeon]|jgi:ferredoxin|nr:(2Fe-2S)-binding protein [Euryarchaeota archaeon]MBT5595269.1 (2Fe-2S)-binding protein [Euryarchaeota archaeon]MBT5844504.1 (2Fe-2S)-binding protein [Euryarchaeota archaeon]MBT6845507.1 (2Fe-2S)-binding protein [Euryarchaeota archaeon]MBT7063540.1 (2Fe-2S)-binding protein [Euryarchaeota archaeon]